MIFGIDSSRLVAVFPARPSRAAGVVVAVAVIVVVVAVVAVVVVFVCPDLSALTPPFLLLVDRRLPLFPQS